MTKTKSSSSYRISGRSHSSFECERFKQVVNASFENYQVHFSEKKLNVQFFKIGSGQLYTAPRRLAAHDTHRFAVEGDRQSARATQHTIYVRAMFCAGGRGRFRRN